MSIIFPSALIIKLLRLIITCNAFEFGNSFGVQKDGTTMRKPCAYNYATIVFTCYRRTSVLLLFKHNLILYLQLIDDIFIFWKDPSLNHLHLIQESS